MYKNTVNMLTLFKNRLNSSTRTVKELGYVQSKFKTIISYIKRYKGSYYSNKIKYPYSYGRKENSKTYTKTLKFILDFIRETLYNIHIKVITSNDRTLNV